MCTEKLKFHLVHKFVDHKLVYFKNYNQQHVSYCLFGSKKHLMTKLFQNRKMPFYQFGEMMYLDKISTEDWVPFIQSRFEHQGKKISTDLAKRICETVENYSSYVQQLAWNVLAETENEATEQDFKNGIEALMAQCSGLFLEQLQGLTSYQLNFLRDGVYLEDPVFRMWFNKK